MKDILFEETIFKIQTWRELIIQKETSISEKGRERGMQIRKWRSGDGRGRPWAAAVHLNKCVSRLCG